MRAFGLHRGLLDLLASGTSVFMSRRAPYQAPFNRIQMSHSRGTLHFILHPPAYGLTKAFAQGNLALM